MEASSEKKKGLWSNKIVRYIVICLIVIILIVAGYFAYVFLSFHRIDDNVQCEVKNAAKADKQVEVGVPQEITSWNIGFAAYLQDYSFFMDGGKESRARSKEQVIDSMNKITNTLNEYNSDYYFIQEVDYDSTRSCKVDERQMIKEAFTTYSYTFAQNYDSPYLFYPILQPHGKNKAGLVTLSSGWITSSIRRSLPIQTDFAKVLDLDRCYDVVRIPTKNGKELVLMNFHLSAYTTDNTIADKQLDMIYKQMQEEYNKGNYVIAGGDFNKDLIGDGGKCFGVTSAEDYSWCQPFKKDAVPAGFTVVVPHKDGEDIASSRLADAPYDKLNAFRITLDGFIVSPNAGVIDSNTIELDYQWSDHNPVYLNFVLN